ncbi:MAG: ABC transporter ATP-binding protein [Proteobacteria bacterium]|nr:ABC transporter ATP-binding protein [Pseudomonadota bacterium]
MADIILADISHSYVAQPDPSEYVLRRVDVHFGDGEAHALLGPSGCGKTTMLNLISGLIHPTSGQIRYGAKDVTRLPTRRRNIAQVFQFPVLYDTMTVFDNLAFPLRNRGRPDSEVKKRVGEIADLLELDSELTRRAANLTPDLKQIISLGRGLVRDDVAAILLDEPLTVIDPQRKWQIRRTLRQVHEQFRHTSIYVTHDQTEALTFADRVWVMNEGKIVQEGSPDELFRRPEHTFVGYFIGTPGMNILPCQLVDGAAMVAGQSIPLSDEVWQQARRDQGSFEIGIRPEFVELVAGGDSTDHGQPGELSVTITAVEDHGRFSIASAELGEHQIKAKLTDRVPPAPGQNARIRFAGGELHLYRDQRIVCADEPSGDHRPAATPAGGN